MPLTPDSQLIYDLFSQGRLLAYGRTETITGNDDQPNGVYLLVEGYIKSYAIGPEGEEYLHLIYGPGEVFPFTWAYLGTGEESNFFTALTPCRVLRVSRDLFLSFIDVGNANQALARQLARQFQIFTYRIDNLEYKTAEQRVAYRLLLLAKRFGTRTSAGMRIEVPITHEIFGNSINLTRESVSRQLEQLEMQGIIQKLEHHIVLKDRSALAAKLSSRTDNSLPNSLLL